MYEEQAQKLVEAYSTENTQFAYDPPHLHWHEENWQEKYPPGWGLTRIGWDCRNLKPSDLEAGRAILEADPQIQVAVIIALLSHPCWQKTPSNHTNYYNDYALQNMTGGFGALLRQLSKRHLPYGPDDIQKIVQTLLARQWWDQALLRALSHPLADPQILAFCRHDLEHLRASIPQDSAYLRPFLQLLNKILGDLPTLPLTLRSDDWAPQVASSLETMDANLRDHWLALLRHCLEARGSIPSSK